MFKKEVVFKGRALHLTVEIERSRLIADADRLQGRLVSLSAPVLFKARELEDAEFGDERYYALEKLRNRMTRDFGAKCWIDVNDVFRRFEAFGVESSATKGLENIDPTENEIAALARELESMKGALVAMETL